MQNVTEYINSVYQDFSIWVNNQNELCELLDLNFQNGHLPNYFNIHIQEFYLLKYAYAYTYEYYRMFKKLCEICQEKLEFNILSFGCGSYLDYYGLTMLLNDIDMMNINYTGIDIVDWKYKCKKRINDKINFYQNDIKNILNEFTVLYENIFVFPNSISDFNDLIFEKICEWFSRVNIASNRIFLLISLRKNEFSEFYDISRSTKITDALYRNGFDVINKPSEYLYFDSERGIAASYPGNFYYPSDVLVYMSGLSDKCKNKNICSKNEKGNLDTKPMLKLNNIKYQILEFRKQ